MTLKTRTPVYIGTPTSPSPDEISKARTLAQILWDKGCLPIMPFLYQELFQPSADDYRLTCAVMFKQCDEAFCIGQPTGETARMFERRGVTPRIV